MSAQNSGNLETSLESLESLPSTDSYLESFAERYKDIKSSSINDEAFDKVVKGIAAQLEGMASTRMVQYQKKASETLKRLALAYGASIKEASQETIKTLYDRWLPHRIKLIEELQDSAEYLDKIVKYGTLLRLVGSSVDTIGAVSGLILKDKKLTYAGYAFQAASAFGFLGLASTVGEVASSKRVLGDIMEHIEKDQEMFEPIVKWVQHIKEVDTAVQEIFPYGIDKTVVREIQESSSALDSYMKIFKAGFVSNVRRNDGLLKDENFLFSLEFFSKTQAAEQWWNWILFRDHPIFLDFARMTLQMEYDHTGPIFLQSIPALPLEQQRVLSLPVGGRIVLNCLTVYDAFNDLRKGGRSKNSPKLKKLRKKMKSELEAFQHIVELMEPQSNERRAYLRRHRSSTA